MRHFVAVIFAVMLLGSFPTSSGVVQVSVESLAPAEVRAQEAKKHRKGKVCPTKNFWLGAGWGADRGKRSHKGMDMAAKRGTPIFAVEAGRINRTKRQSNGACIKDRVL